MKNIIILSNRDWNNWIVQDLNKSFANKYNFELISEKTMLQKSVLDKLEPEWIFVPHWSYLIPEEVYTNFECVIFHMTDLPHGRGGSPLQNLISRGHKKTKVSAIKCIEELDAGPIYIKQELDLSGSAQQIFTRMSYIIRDMIISILNKKIEPSIQKGEATFFKRRTPSQSNIKNLNNIEEIYDNIRMLDAEGYPKAFLELNDFKLELYNAHLENGEINASVRICTK